MTEPEGTTNRRKVPVVRVATVAAAAVCLLLTALYLLASTYLHTPSAARQASRLLTDYLHYPVTVAGLSLRGGTLSMSSLTIGNPADFKGGELVRSGTITITPEWRAFLEGKKSFADITIRGLAVTVARNATGEWNFSELARLMAEKKGGGETLIKRLAVSGASLAVEKFRFDNLALMVNDLSTKGTTGSRIVLTCTDAGGNPLRIEGNVRLGKVPEGEVTLSAPSFSPITFARSFGKDGALPFTDGSAALFLALQLRNGKMAAQGKLALQHTVLAIKNSRVPVNGELTFAGSYDPQRDQASLDDCSLRLDRVARVRASAAVQQVRHKKSFAATVAVDAMELKDLCALLPRELRRDVDVTGTVRASVFHLSGDAKNGVTAGSGSVTLRGGAVTRGGRLLVKDLAADAALTKVKDGWRLNGRALQGTGGDGGTVQALDGTFTADFSNRLKPLQGGVPSFSARIVGFPAKGTLAYRPERAVPLTARLDVRQAPISRLTPFIARQDVTFAAGTLSLSVQLAGRGPREFRGNITTGFAGIQGSAAGTPFAVKDGVIETELDARGGKVSAAGRINCRGTYGQKPMDVVVSYGVRDGGMYLSDGILTLAGTEVRLSRLQGTLPAPVHTDGMTRLPVRLELTDMAVRSGDAALDGLTGKLAVDYVAGQGKRWLEGRGTVAIKKLTYRGEDTGSLEGELGFADNGATADIRGKLLNGRLNGTANLDPFNLKKRIGFSLTLDGIHCAELAAFEPAKVPVKVAEGLLDVRLTGEYGQASGLRCRLETAGRGIALTGKEGKSLLTDGGVKAVGEVAGNTLFIREGAVTTGTSVAVKLKGELTHPFAPDREGDISYALAATPVDSLRAQFVNLLPRVLQEASVTGTVATAGRIRLTHGQAVLDGTVNLERFALDIPSQKFSADGMTGTIPLSLDLSNAPRMQRPERLKYSRENYPSLVAALRQAASSEPTFRIGRVRLGGMELADTSLSIRAGNGLVEITSLQSGLFEGALFGEGFFRYGHTMQYGIDLTIGNLSLRTLCSAYPNIKGYITGRVDGIVSLYEEGNGLSGLRGFTNIWTRSIPDEKMEVSKEFLQKLAGRKFKGIFFRDDRPYDRGEISGYLANGYLTFDTLDISHTTFFGVKDLSVAVAPVQNRIAISHLFNSIREAATRGKAVGEGEAPTPAPTNTEFKWQE